jgi:hypothetical protein
MESKLCLISLVKKKSNNNIFFSFQAIANRKQQKDEGYKYRGRTDAKGHNREETAVYEKWSDSQ